jgi:GH25 family lysozyme M1 (1,4-beta-N-acetylmuramidase)
MKTDYPIWLAHYTREPLDYSKEAKIWQVSSIASVPGINAYVDVDIMYK